MAKMTNTHADSHCDLIVLCSSWSFPFILGTSRWTSLLPSKSDINHGELYRRGLRCFCLKLKRQFCGRSKAIWHGRRGRHEFDALMAKLLMSHKLILAGLGLILKNGILQGPFLGRYDATDIYIDVYVELSKHTELWASALPLNL